MSKNKKNQGKKDKGWTKVGTFQTFAEADAKRNKIAESPNVQTKVRRRDSANNFTVHYRELPEVKSKKSGKD